MNTTENRASAPTAGESATASLGAQPHGGRGRETVRRTRTRERLMDAAYRLFATHGINGTSIEAVADDAGFTRGAFYSNFGSKTELFFALTDRENETRVENLRRLLSRMLEPLKHGGKPEQSRIEGVIADILTSQPVDRQWCLMHGEFRMLAMRDPEVAARFLEAERAFQRQLADIVEAATRSIGIYFVIDPLELTQLLVTRLESAMQEAILSGAGDPERAARESVMRSMPTLIDRLTEASCDDDATD